MNVEQILELDKVKTILRTYAQTDLGKQMVDEMQVLTIERQITYRLKVADEALTIIKAVGAAPLGGASDIGEWIQRAVIESVLGAEELLAIKNFLISIDNLKSFQGDLLEAELETPLFNKQLAPSSSIKTLQNVINKAIDETGKVVDDASPELKGIRKSIASAQGSARSKIGELLNSRKEQLTESLITMRNGRFTLPVKAEYKNSFKGTIHDQSSTGQTTYIEPLEVVELSNKLQGLLVAEQAEVHRILKMITEQVASSSEQLMVNIETVGQLDFMFAKGRYAHAINAVMPKISEGNVKLIQARHPLIDQKTVVANDIVIDQLTKAMVITGPNTGGKTVTLKTIGLLSLMMQSGMLIPVHETSEMVIFDQVFADIGDEQSIEQSLSTFSSHMKQIVRILRKLTENSLVLFDELGSGTDPKEGASLAMAILDDVKQKARFTIATSHYSELKAYAYDASDVANASVEFDVDTLSPTYRLLLGVPGRSNAFEISNKLGLPAMILEAAQTENAANITEVSELIRKIEDKGLELDQLLQKTESENKQALLLKKEYEAKMEKFEATRTREMERARLEGEQAVKEARETAEAIVKELRAMKKNNAVKDHELTDRLATLNDAQARHVQQFKKQAKNEKPLAVGDDVMVLSLARQGELLKLNKNGDWQVAMGSMTVNIKPADLQYIKPQGKPKPKRNVRGGSMSVKGNSSAKGKLDLRGIRYEEAMLMLDQYFDQVMLANYDVVTIIHGHGTGAIRNGVQKYLRGKTFVAEFRFGGEAEGGMGATVVTLR